MANLEYTPTKDIPEIVQSLRNTFMTDLSFRKEQLRNLKRFCIEQTDVLKKTLYADLRKHSIEANVGEISLVVEECSYMIKELDRLAKPTYTKKRFQMNRMDQTYIRKEPKGVVTVLGAWNYPVNLLLLPVVGAIAAGCCVVIKPSEVSAHTAAAMAELLPKYLDKRAYTVVNGAAEETTVLWVKDQFVGRGEEVVHLAPMSVQACNTIYDIIEQRLDHIFYTGNGTVGRIIMAAAAKNLTPVTLELGGKSPVVIAPDADLEITANRLLWGKFYNCGQTCVAPDYVLITKDRVPAFIEKVRKVLSQFYTENPQKSDSYGRIVNHRHFDRLKRLLDAVDPKSIVVGGQTDRDDLFIAPTIVTDVHVNDVNLMADEIFGPILPIVPVDDIQEAIHVINSRDHPLALYIFTNCKKTYNEILDNTNSGGALINDTLMHLQEVSLPFGGVGPSGMGNYHGDNSFDTFTHQRSTMVKSTTFESVMAAKYPPYTDDKEDVMNVLVYGMPDGVVHKVQTMFSTCAATFRILFGNPSM